MMFSKDFFGSTTLIKEPKCLQELYAIRRAISKDMQDMTIAEQREYFHKGTEEFFAGSGLKPNYSH